MRLRNSKLKSHFYEFEDNIIKLTAYKSTYPKLDKEDIYDFFSLDIQTIQEIHPEYIFACYSEFGYKTAIFVLKPKIDEL